MLLTNVRSPSSVCRSAPEALSRSSILRSTTRATTLPANDCSVDEVGKYVGFCALGRTSPDKMSITLIRLSVVHLFNEAEYEYGIAVRAASVRPSGEKLINPTRIGGAPKLRSSNGGDDSASNILIELPDPEAILRPSGENVLG